MGDLFNSSFGIIIYFAFLFGIMWFIMVRPQRKREKAMQEMQDSIKVGDSVVTSAGMYGKVVDIINDLFIIEFGLNRGIRIPLEKAAVTSVKEPQLKIIKDDQFEIEEDEDEDQVEDDK